MKNRSPIFTAAAILFALAGIFLASRFLYAAPHTLPAETPRFTLFSGEYTDHGGSVRKVILKIDHETGAVVQQKP